MNQYNAKLLRQLREINQTGDIEMEAGKLLLEFDYIRACGPRPGVCNYNCYCLTDTGKAELDRLTS